VFCSLLAQGTAVCTARICEKRERKGKRGKEVKKRKIEVEKERN